MIDPHFEGRSGFRHYSRGPDPWRPEDDWGPAHRRSSVSHYHGWTHRLRQRPPLGWRWSVGH
jgi:hypothetical protein